MKNSYYLNNLRLIVHIKKGYSTSRNYLGRHCQGFIIYMIAVYDFLITS